MAVLKCKMCGGNLEVIEGQNYATCDSCGSTMTLPKVNDERIVNLFNRATHYRQQNEFDKALATYESILEEDNENAEAHWGCVLSRYGIEYVEDTKTHERIPTCHRLQNNSVLADLDYKEAIKYAPDNHSAELYKLEAERISEIQKGILNIARNEKPYDIFICYKESDVNGRRTIDSTLAQDIYFQLTNEGYKVFFSRITLEDKIGQEYEPYIFAALNSAKVMLVVGTKAEHFNAVWVKNEWARFLDITKKDKSKLIIPCYRDMDAYDLPDELSMFQSQDMSKIGFIQDLTRGIKKILQSNSEAEPHAAIVTQSRDYSLEIDGMLKRAFIFLEDAEWNKADQLLENVLNLEPENATAYLGKLMIEAKVNKEENLSKRAIKLSEMQNYQKAVRYADESLKAKLETYNLQATELFEKIHEENERKRIEEEKRLALQGEKNNKHREIINKNFDDVKKFRLPFVISSGVSGIIFFIIFCVLINDSFYVATMCMSIVFSMLLGVAAIFFGTIGGKKKAELLREMKTNEDFENIEILSGDYKNHTIPLIKKAGYIVLAVTLCVFVLSAASESANKSGYNTFCEKLKSPEYIAELLENKTPYGVIKSSCAGQGRANYDETGLSLYNYEKDVNVDFHFENNVLSEVTANVNMFFDVEYNSSSVNDLLLKIGNEYTVEYSPAKDLYYFMIRNVVFELPYFTSFDDTLDNDYSHDEFSIYIDDDNIFRYGNNVSKTQASKEKQLRLYDNDDNIVLDTNDFTEATVNNDSGEYKVVFQISTQGTEKLALYIQERGDSELELYLGYAYLGTYTFEAGSRIGRLLNSADSDVEANDIADKANKYIEANKN